YSIGSIDDQCFRRVILYPARASVIPKEPPFNGFKSSASLRTPGEIFSLRRVERGRVGAGTGGNFPGRAARNWHDKNFVVRAGRFDLLDVACVRDLLAVWRNRIHVLPA